MQRKMRTRIKTRIKSLLLLTPYIIIIVGDGVVAAVDTSSIQEQYEQVSPFSMISLSLPNMKMNCNHHRHNYCSSHHRRRRGKYKEEQQSQVLVEKWNDIQKQYRQKYHYQQQQQQQQQQRQQNLQLIDNYYYYTKFERQLMGLQPFIIQSTCTGTVPTDKTHTNTVTTTTSHHTHQHTSTTSTTSTSSTPQHQHSSSTNKNSSSFTSNVQPILYSILLPIGTIFVLTTISSLAETIYYNKSSILSSISTNYSWVSNCIDTFYLLKVMDWKSIPFAIANLVWNWNNDYNDISSSGSGSSSNNSSSNNSSSSSSNQHDKEYSNTILLRNEKKTIMSYIMSYYSHSNMSSNIVSSIQHIVQNNIISPIKSYIINHELIPRTHQIITKLIYMELWRHFWIEIFVFLRTHVYKTLSFAFMSSSFMSVMPTSSYNNNNNNSHNNNNSYKSSFWEKNAPGFLKRGLKSLFIKYAQGHLEKLIGDWFTKGYDFIGLEVVGGNSWTLMEKDHNDHNDDNDNDDVDSDYDVNNTI